MGVQHGISYNLRNRDRLAGAHETDEIPGLIVKKTSAPERKKTRKGEVTERYEKEKVRQKEKGERTNVGRTGT